MHRDPYDYGFGSVWHDAHVDCREGYTTSVTGYHTHDFYEINLILSGSVRILLGDRIEESRGCRLVMTAPGTPHYIACRPDTLYSRMYLVFTPEYIADYLPEWTNLAAWLGSGRILTLPDADAAICRRTIREIASETNSFRRRLIIYCLLSRLCESAGAPAPDRRVPAYIPEALRYMEENYAARITAQGMADALHVGRTTLLCGLHAHTGMTFGEYLTDCRLKHAVRLLRAGHTLETAAPLCGFADASGLIRAFRRRHGMPPGAFLAGMENKQSAP